MFGCKHNWKVESTSYTPPEDIEQIEYKGSGGDALKGILQGTTHVYMRCKKCGDLKEKQVFGEYKPELTEE